MFMKGSGALGSSRWSSAVLAILVVVAITALRAQLDEQLRDLPFILYLPAVLYAAYFGRLRAALLATTLSLLLGWYLFTPPRNTFVKGTANDVIRAILFVSSGIAIGGMSEVVFRSRREARRSAQRFNSTFENAAFGMAKVSLGGACTRVNQRLCTILDRTHEELLGRDWISLLSPEDREHAAERFRRLLAGESETESAEQRFSGSGGAVLCLSVTTSVHRDEDGSPEYFILSAEDITARKQAQEHAKHLAAIVEATPDFVAIARLEDGCITYLNHAGRRLLGLEDVADVTHIPQSQLFPPRVRKVMEEEWLPAALRNGAAAAEGALLTADGEEIPASFSLVVHKEADGTPHSVSTIARDMSESKRTERRIQESEERLRLALSAGRMGAWDWDLSSDQVVWSDGLGHLSGLDETQRPRTFSAFVDLIHPDDRDRVREAVERALREDAYYDVEFRIATPSGMRWALRRGRVLRDESGRPVRMLGVGADISERKRIDEALRSSSERLAMALEAAAMVAWEWIPHTNDTHLTGDVQRVVGSDAARLQAKKFLALVHPEDRDGVQRARQRCLEQGGDYAAEFRLVHPDGSVRWVSDRGHRVQAAGQSRRMLGILVDITERKRTEEELRASEERLRLAQAASGIGIWDWDLGSGKMAWSPEIYGFLGLQPASAEPSLATWSQFIHPEDRAAAVESVIHALRTCESFNTEFRVLTASGGVRWLLALGKVFADSSGAAERLAGVNLDISERKQAEVELRRAEQQRRLITDSLPVLISYVDAEGRYQFNNKTYEVWFGNNAAHVHGRRVQDVIGEAAYRTIEPHLQAALRGEPQTFEALLPYRHVGTRHVQAQYVPDRAEDGTVRGYFALIEDITERKRLERSLRDSEERYRSIVEAAAEGIWIIDTSGRTAFVNRRMAELLGCAEEEVIGRSCFDYLHPDEQERAREGFQRRKREGDLEAREYRFVRSDGGIVWLSFVGSPMYDGNGSMTGVLAMCTDTTGRHAAEQRIHELNAELMAKVGELETLLNVIPVGIAFTYDPDCRTVRLNPAGERLFGMAGSHTGRNASLTGPEAASLPYRMTRDGHEIPADDLPLQTTVRTGEALREVEFEIVRQDGEVIDAVGWTSPLVAASGDRVGAVAAYLDLSERKRMEKALRRANAALEQFAYAAAHDLQEPVRNVSLYTQLIARRYDGKLDPRADDYMRITVEGARRMQNLIQDLLSYTRATSARDEAGAYSEAGVAMEEVLGNLRTAIETAQARIAYEGLPLVGVRYSELVQLLQNLVSNALKYRGAEPPLVHVSAQEHGKQWVFTVRDNGQGIAPDYHERIFRIFKRLHGRDVPGTGIGLAICERIVTHYGGRIWVESEVGKGAAFHFTLPGVEGVAAQASSASGVEL